MITREKLEHHILHLEEKHKKIDNDITELYKIHGNDLKIETLKKVKLHLKDEIEKFKTQLTGL
jgi:hypothetical protein